MHASHTERRNGAKKKKNAKMIIIYRLESTFIYWKGFFLLSIHSTSTFKYLLCPRFIINTMSASLFGYLWCQMLF